MAVALVNWSLSHGELNHFCTPGPTRSVELIVAHLQMHPQGLEATRSGSPKVWEIQGLEATRSGSPKVWEIQGLEATRYGSPKVWELQGLEATRSGRHKVWEP